MKTQAAAERPFTISSATENEILAYRPESVTPDFVLDVYARAKELKSNRLMNYAKYLSGRVGHRLESILAKDLVKQILGDD